MLTDILPLKRPLISLDLETTGIRFSDDRILQIGICKQYPNGDYTEWETLVIPGIPIPKEAASVHGIDELRVTSCKTCGGCRGDKPRTSSIERNENGTLHVEEKIYPPCSCVKFTPWPTMKELAPKLVKGFEGCDFSGYNIAGFDVRMMAAELARCGIVWPPPKMVDSFRIWQRVAPRNLRAAVRDYLGEDLTDAHGALPDARAAIRLIPKLLERHPELPRTVEGLHHMFFEAVEDGYVDVDKKLVWKNDEVVLNFGKYIGHPLKRVIQTNRKYIEWVSTSNFPANTQRILKQALSGQYPKRA